MEVKWRFSIHVNLQTIVPCMFLCLLLNVLLRKQKKNVNKLFWDNGRAQSLVDTLNSKRGSFDEIISLPLEQLADVNGCVQQLTDLMYDSCFSIFGKTVSTKRNENSSKASWFNPDCKRAKSDFYSSKRMFKMSPTNENKARFFANKKAFRNAKYKAESVYIKRTKRDMSNLGKTSPRKFWKKLISLGKASFRHRIGYQ